MFDVDLGAGVIEVGGEVEVEVFGVALEGGHGVEFAVVFGAGDGAHAGVSLVGGGGGGTFVGDELVVGGDAVDL